MRPKRLLLDTSLILASLGLASHAWAQAAQQYHVILLDQTGSMQAPGQDHGKLKSGAPAVNSQVFDNAVNAAMNWVYTDQGTPNVVRAYAIYTFKDDSCCGGGNASGTILPQRGIRKIWPIAPASGAVPGCDINNDNSKIEPATGFCIFTGGDTTPYGSLMTVLDNLRAAVVQGTTKIYGDPDNMLAPIVLPASEPKGGASYDTSLYGPPVGGLGPNTPLADSICQTVEALKVAASNQTLTFTLETDGGENSSALQTLFACAGTDAGLVSGVTAFTKSLSDWGLTGGGWQSNTMRRIVRIKNNTQGTIGSDVGANDAIDTKLINLGAIVPTPPPPNQVSEDVPLNSSWRIDVHYSICDNNYPLLSPCKPIVPGLAAVSSSSATSSRESAQFWPAPPPVKFTTGLGPNAIVATPMAAAATTASTRTQTISPAELAFFSSWGKVNSKSAFRQFVRDPTLASAVHVPKIPGDVDDSGCTDIADFNIIIQKDVYLARAVLPNQLAIRADLNGDQLVNREDAKIVLANWGKGCKNSVGPKPKIP